MAEDFLQWISPLQNWYVWMKRKDLKGNVVSVTASLLLPRNVIYVNLWDYCLCILRCSTYKICICIYNNRKLASTFLANLFHFSVLPIQLNTNYWGLLIVFWNFRSTLTQQLFNLNPSQCELLIRLRSVGDRKYALVVGSCPTPSSQNSIYFDLLTFQFSVLNPPHQPSGVLPLFVFCFEGFP